MITVDIYTSSMVADVQSHQLLPIYQGPPRTCTLLAVTEPIDPFCLGTIAER
jgi:hypothetical protein